MWRWKSGKIQKNFSKISQFFAIAKLFDFWKIFLYFTWFSSSHLRHSALRLAVWSALKRIKWKNSKLVCWFSVLRKKTTSDSTAWPHLGGGGRMYCSVAWGGCFKNFFLTLIYWIDDDNRPSIHASAFSFEYQIQPAKLMIDSFQKWH